MSAATNTARGDSGDLQAAIARNTFWYHTIEVAPGVTTPGWFDLRPIVDRLPWPDVRGKRCLDIGTWDGFLAFELERRGAAEVVATDILDHELWDWPPHLRAKGVEFRKAVGGPEQGAGFPIAKELLGSSVTREDVNIYDLSPDLLGTFDVVTCGSLLLHLRDPLRALEAVRSVCRGHFLSTNQVDLRPSVRNRKVPVARLDGVSDLCQWWLPNAAGHRRMLEASAFEIEAESGLYSIPYGVSHPKGRKLSPNRLFRAAARRIFTGNDGVPHHAVLARASVS